MKIKVIYPMDDKPGSIYVPANRTKTRIWEYEIPAEDLETMADNGGEADSLAICEHVFRQFNHVDGSEYISTAGFDGLDERSFSVGDMVEIEGETFSCMTFGFRRIDAGKRAEMEGMTFEERALA